MGQVTKLLSVVAMVTMFVGQVEAGVIVGGSSLLGAGDVTQLETWLGEGSLILTNIFTKTVAGGQTSIDFHNAVDGIGRTFSVMEVLPTNSNPNHIVGGYNPQSWSSINDYNYTPNDVDRTAFIFNLNTALKLDQRLGDPQGRYQTLNHVSYGPTFGGGFDISSLNQSLLSDGYLWSFTYGASGLNLLGNAGQTFVDSGTIEVFTITAVPEPSTFILSALGLGIAGLVTRRQRKKAA